MKITELLYSLLLVLLPLVFHSLVLSRIRDLQPLQRLSRSPHQRLFLNLLITHDSGLSLWACSYSLVWPRYSLLRPLVPQMHQRAQWNRTNISNYHETTTLQLIWKVLSFLPMCSICQWDLLRRTRLLEGIRQILMKDIDEGPHQGLLQLRDSLQCLFIMTLLSSHLRFHLLKVLHQRQGEPRQKLSTPTTPSLRIGILLLPLSNQVVITMMGALPKEVRCGYRHPSEVLSFSSVHPHAQHPFPSMGRLREILLTI